MRVNKDYTVEVVEKSLERKGVKIVDNNTIDISGAKNIGIKSWGKIDFLRYHERYFFTGLDSYGKGRKEGSHDNKMGK
jgi:hypothetical protein